MLPGYRGNSQARMATTTPTTAATVAVYIQPERGAGADAGIGGVLVCGGVCRLTSATMTKPENISAASPPITPSVTSGTVSEAASEAATIHVFMPTSVPTPK